MTHTHFSYRCLDLYVTNKQIMARICCEAENSLNNDALYQAVRNTVISEQVQFEQLQF
jgi:hypothetical protein